MTDRLIERDCINAKMLAEGIDPNRIREGIGIISRMPYFSQLMIKYNLNPNSEEHCRLAKESLEERLKAAGNEMILRPFEGLLVLGQDDFKGFYFSECRRVKEELLDLYRKMKQEKIPPFTKDIFRKDNERYYKKIIYDNSWSVGDYDEKSKWSTEDCLHGICSIKIKKSFFRKDKIYGLNCEHISNGVWNNFEDEINKAYLFYFENPMISADILSRFEYYFSLFRKIPDELRKIIEGKELASLKKDMMQRIIGAK